MTTEIAVLNRLGVALAADSAVTISGGGTTKVFDSADKLFELSTVHPIAMMLNGNMDCFGVPWEIIIKDFREEEGHLDGRSVLQWASDFVKFVESRNDVGPEAAINYVMHIAEAEIYVLNSRFTEKLLSTSQKKKVINFDQLMIPTMAGVISERRAELAALPVAQSLSDVTVEQIHSEYAEKIKEVVDLRLIPASVNEANKLEAINFIVDALRALIANTFSTGLIIAGYGAGDIYPSVSSVDIDGYISGKLKYSQVNSRAKIEKSEFGYAVSFAQTDVIERLLSGVDPRFIAKTSYFLTSAAETLAPIIVDALTPKARKSKKSTDTQKIKEILETINDNYLNETSAAFKSEFREEFERMIALERFPS